MNNDNAPLLPMPIKVKPYAHQINAFNFVCKMFGLVPTGGDSDDESHSEMLPVRKSIQTLEKPSS